MNLELYAILLDIILAAIGILIVIGSWRSGFLRTAVLLVGYASSVVVAFWLSERLAVMVYDNFIRGFIQTGIDNAVASSVNGMSFDTVLPTLFESWPKVIVNPILAAFGGEKELLHTLEESTGGVLSNLGNTVAGTLVAPIVTSLLRIIFCLLIFLICVIIVRSIAGLFKRFYAVPILGTLNSLLGGLLGVAKAALFLLLLAMIVSLVISISGNRLGWLNTDIVQSTRLLKPLYEVVV